MADYVWCTVGGLEKLFNFLMLLHSEAKLVDEIVIPTSKFNPKRETLLFLFVPSPTSVQLTPNTQNGGGGGYLRVPVLFFNDNFC